MFISFAALKIFLQRPRVTKLIGFTSVILSTLVIILSALVYLDAIEEAEKKTVTTRFYLVHYAPQCTEATTITGIFQAISSLLFLMHIEPLRSWRWLQLLSFSILGMCLAIDLFDFDLFSNLTPYFSFYVAILLIDTLFCLITSILAFWFGGDGMEEESIVQL